MAVASLPPMITPGNALSPFKLQDLSSTNFGLDLGTQSQAGAMGESSTKAFFAAAMVNALKNSLQTIDRSAGGVGRVVTNFHGYQPRLEEYFEHQRRVYELGVNNTVSTRSTINVAEKKPNVVSELIQKVVQGLLSEENLRKNGMDRVNSNEPALLINLARAEDMNSDLIRLIRDEVVKSLKYGHGCAPVRVLVRLDGDAEDDNAENLELVVLNVVNSETGGPSMIQLLDAAFYGAGWKIPDPENGTMMVSKEAWSTGGWDLLWRDEAAVGDHTEEPVAPTSIDLDQLEAETDHEVVAEKVPDVLNHAEPVEITAEIADEHDAEKAVETQLDSEKMTPPSFSDDGYEEEMLDVTDHPAMIELRTAESNRPSIQHPSWSRGDESESLLDLIRQQSSTIANTVEMDHTEAEYGETSVRQVNDDAKAASEDGFEMV